jgi:hypothetical protein
LKFEWSKQPCFPLISIFINIWFSSEKVI